MKARIRLPQGSVGRAAERRDMDAYWDKKYEETRRALQDDLCKEMAAYATAMDATILWTLHTKLGYGYVRLRRFWEDMIKTRIEFRTIRDKDYQVQRTGQNIEDFALARFLLDIGVDLKAWEDEGIQYDEETGEVTFTPTGADLTIIKKGERENEAV